MRCWLLKIAGTYVHDCTSRSFSGGSRNTAKRFSTWREAVDFTTVRFPELPFCVEVAPEEEPADTLPRRPAQNAERA